MAITPRSILLNPTLFLLGALCVAAVGLLVSVTTSSAPRVSYWESVRDQCPTADAEPNAWTHSEWDVHVRCFLDAGDYSAAYAAASEGARYFPASELLLNYKGYAAGRNQEHGVAAMDFRAGLRVTGSPSGIFENNLAWTMLFQADDLPVPRRDRVLWQARELYRMSLHKGVSCERIHTGMFVEYGLAATAAPDRRAGDFERATSRYYELREWYAPCWERVRSGDPLVTEEILSAAVLDQEMARLQGVHTPTAHVPHLAAARQAGATPQTCDLVVPFRDILRACKVATR